MLGNTETEAVAVAEAERCQLKKERKEERGERKGTATLMATAGRDVASLFALTDTLRDDDMAACVAGCRSCWGEGDKVGKDGG